MKINAESSSTKEKESDHLNRYLVEILKNNFKKVVVNYEQTILTKTKS